MIGKQESPSSFSPVKGILGKFSRKIKPLSIFASLSNFVGHVDFSFEYDGIHSDE
jgi:hypothetical protein